MIARVRAHTHTHIAGTRGIQKCRGKRTVRSTQHTTYDNNFRV